MLTRCLMVRQLRVVWVGWLLFSTPTLVVSFVGRFLGGFYLAFCKYSSFALNFGQYTLLRSCAQVRVCVWSLVALTRRPVVQILILESSGAVFLPVFFQLNNLHFVRPPPATTESKREREGLDFGRRSMNAVFFLISPGHAICKAPPL